MTLRVQIVGGFLGAGKTSLLRSAARILAARGERVALVTNDQGHSLVDTSLCARDAELALEIPGGCFCCRYPELEQALASAEQAGATVVLAEAVGSCTDLVATVLAPLDERSRGRVTLAPLAVVVDPFRLIEARLDAEQASDDVGYLYRKQIEEADVVLLSRADLGAPDVRARIEAIRPGVTALTVSGTTGLGVEAWLAARPTHPAQPLVLDYDRYAAAEASLGWLNARVHVRGAPHAPAQFATRFLRALEGAPVAHVKLVSEVPPGVHAALVGSNEPPFVSASVAEQEHSRWLVNARVGLPPADVEALVRRSLADAATPALAELFDVECFRPARPVPTHRHALRVLHDSGSCTPLAR